MRPPSQWLGDVGVRKSQGGVQDRIDMNHRDHVAATSAPTSDSRWEHIEMFAPKPHFFHVEQARWS